MRVHKNCKGKKIVIVGLSRSGFAAALLAREKKARVFVTDAADTPAIREKAARLRKKGITVESGGHHAAFLEGAGLMITSPGVRHDAPPLVWARKHRVPVISEIEFAGWFCRLPVVAITGSNGKTTVTTLLGEIFKNARRGPVVCGNIGNPFCGENRARRPGGVVILEVSSFQLQDTVYFRPKVGIILNITQNHFDHHRSMNEYAQAKAKIFANQRANDFTVLNFDDPKLRRYAAKTRGRVLFFAKKYHPALSFTRGSYGACWLEGTRIVGQWKGRARVFLDGAAVRLKGMHNLENIMAALLAAQAQRVGVTAMLKTIKDFRGVEHRCEPAGSRRGIVFVNDSKSTTVDATVKALSMFADGSVVLICGGRDKGSDFRPIRDLVRKKVARLILIGEAGRKISAAMGAGIKKLFAPTLEQAVKDGYEHAAAGMTVLLSPMCASFDMFENFEHRGTMFKSAVRRLLKS